MRRESNAPRDRRTGRPRALAHVQSSDAGNSHGYNQHLRLRVRLVGTEKQDGEVAAMSDQENKDIERVKKAVETLSEFFDTCQIFCTRHESGEMDGTVNVKQGVGNWFARYGQVKEWVLIEEEVSRSKVRKDND